MSVKKELAGYFAGDLRSMLSGLSDDFLAGASEIRLRAERPVMILKGGKEYFPDKDGKMSADGRGGICPDREALAKCVELLCDYSPYAFEAEIRAGYVTIPGGHRVGLCGRAVTEGGKLKTLKDIGALTVRVAHEVKGCADGVMPVLADQNPPYPVRHTLIVSPPGCGKTTLLRDIVRQLSDGAGFPGKAVALVDERSEVAGCYRGVPQCDVGIRTDVLDGCPKSEGMLLLLRAMSPAVIAADEIGKDEDASAIEAVITAGVALVCTAHGACMEDLKKRPALRGLLNQKVFTRFIFLGKPGHIHAVLDENGNHVFRTGAA